MNLGIAAIQASALLGGKAPTVASVSPVNPRGGQPLSWSGLGQNAVGASVALPVCNQIRLTAGAGSVFGTDGVGVVQVTPDNVNWQSVAAITDPVLPGVALPSASSGSFGGLAVTPIAGGVSLSVLSDPQPLYARVIVQGGDGSTAISISGTAGIGAL
jgi:hypothetical protein